MANNSLIKQTFGNHDTLRQYLACLNDIEILPPFMPVLHREQACGPNDVDIIISNERSHHREKNRQVMRQLVEQFTIYQELINSTCAINTVNE